MSVKEVKGRPGWFDVVVYERVRVPGERPAKIQRRRKGLRVAEKLERDLIRQRDSGSLVARRQTLSHYADAYLASRRAEVSAQTWEGYQSAVDRYVKAYPIGSLPLEDVTRTAVATFYADVLENGARRRGVPIQKATVTGIHRVLSMILRGAYDDGLLDRNPCDAVNPPKDNAVQEEDDEPGVDPQTATAFLRLAEGTPVYAIAAVALGTGLRRSELVALRWRDVDLEAGELNVNGKIEQVGKRAERRAPKSKRSIRTVPFGPSVTRVLKRQRAAIAERKLASREPLWDGRELVPLWVDEDWVFPALRLSRAKDGTHLPRGRMWTPSALAQQWRQCRGEINQTRLRDWLDGGNKEEDFDRWTFGLHALRHCYGTVQLVAGVRLELVSRRMGHSSSQVTLRIYSHLIQAEMRDGVEVADGLI